MEYPAHELARPAAPPYRGEGPHAMWHFSEDPGLTLFHPHVPKTNPSAPAAVWAVDTRHAPLFWFPRDCPRGCAWVSDRTSAADRARFFEDSSAVVPRIHVIESAWRAAVQQCRLYAYALPDKTFVPHPEVGGYWLSQQSVEPFDRLEVGDLLARHAQAGIELRVTPSLWPWWHAVIQSTLEYSGCRLRNTSPELLCSLE